MPKQKYSLGGICDSGHQLTEETYKRYKNGSNGYRYVCLECDRARTNKRRKIKGRNKAYSRQYSADYRIALKYELSVAEYRASIAEQRSQEDDLARKDDDRPMQPWNLWKPSPNAQPHLDALNAAIAETGRTPCFDNPGPYMDYDEDRPPSVVEASRLCMDCNVRELCLAYAVNEEPKKRFGVWGGEVFGKNGERLYG